MLSVSQTVSEALDCSTLKRRPVLRRVTPPFRHSAFLGDIWILLVINFIARVSTPISKNQAQVFCEWSRVFVMIAYLHSLLPPSLLPSMSSKILTVNRSISAYPFWCRQGDNTASSKLGAVSGAFDSLSQDLSARHFPLLKSSLVQGSMLALDLPHLK